MEIERIFENVKSIITESCEVPVEEIKLEHTLFDELAIDSIDLVDILFEMESEYDISLKVSDLEKHAVRTLGSDVPYEIDGVITKEGLSALKEFMTEIPTEKFRSGLTVTELIKLFTVESLCKLTQHKILEKN
ncbi:MAG: acyl carrier protein [Bacteroidales bacterium]|nr:acyl carrier protein [Bacteroidales bacterium]